MSVHDTSEPRHEPEQPHRLSWHTDPHGERPDGEGRPRLLSVRMAVGLMDALRTQRPEWSELDIMSALDQVRQYPPADTFRAALFAAHEPHSTPELIAVGGRHWDAVGMRAPSPEPPPVHRPKRSREQRRADPEWRPAWRDDPGFQATREKEWVPGRVFGVDVEP